MIVTLYNYEQYIETHSKRPSANSPKPRTVVIDDVSTDGSVSVAVKWLRENSARFSRARLISHAKDSGLAQARNTAFENAANDYVLCSTRTMKSTNCNFKTLTACLSANAQPHIAK